MLSLAAAAAGAADYTVQIGAFRNPDPSFAESASRLGSVHTSRSEAGLTRFLVGRFPTRSAAQALLEKLRGAGYSDAFVRRADPAPNLPDVAQGPRPSAAAETGDASLESLPADVRDKVVRLDGVLHIKEGDRFTPLSEAAP
jgi:cell division septation protein DedD